MYKGYWHFRITKEIRACYISIARVLRKLLLPRVNNLRHYKNTKLVVTQPVDLLFCFVFCVLKTTSHVVQCIFRERKILVNILPVILK